MLRVKELLLSPGDDTETWHRRVRVKWCSGVEIRLAHGATFQIDEGCTCQSLMEFLNLFLGLQGCRVNSDVQQIFKSHDIEIEEVCKTLIFTCILMYFVVWCYGVWSLSIEIIESTREYELMSDPAFIRKQPHTVGGNSQFTALMLHIHSRFLRSTFCKCRASFHNYFDIQSFFFLLLKKSGDP